MAWPKKGTRKIVVDQEEFLWHYDACCPWCSNDVFTAGRSGEPYVLFIDPFPYAAEIGPKYIARAISWAIKQGWSTSKGPTRALSIDSTTGEFYWLQNDERHANCMRPAPEKV